MTEKWHIAHQSTTDTVSEGYRVSR